MSERRLLILDDDAMIGETIGRIAQFAGMQVHYTPSPTEFLHQVDDWAPSHVALDLVMPEMDGVEVIHRLGQQGCGARIIITSGLGTRVLDAAARSAREQGLDIAGVLSKPFSSVALRQLLETAPNSAAQSPPGGTATGGSPVQVTSAMVEAAITEKQFRPVYQPKVDCYSGILTGFEALARWHHPQHGTIGPDRFIPVAEASDLIQPLTDQLLEEALTWFRQAGRRHGHRETTLAVNLSARSLNDHHLADRLSQRCRTLGLDPTRIILELTESSAMDDPAASLELLTRLRMKGFHLSIDDFGTGYSSMVQLVRLPFSEVKIDRSFTSTAVVSAESRAIVRSIVQLGHSLGIPCTAEGVEDAATVRLLRELTCDHAQGYFIGRPMTPADLDEWMAENANRFPGNKG